MNEGKGTVELPENVIELRPEADRPSLQAENAYKACSHDRSIVDAKTRTVRCKDCGETLSPFERLLRTARNWDREWHRVLAARKEASRLNREIADKKKELRSLDGKIKRRKAKLLKLDPGPRAIDDSGVS